MSLIRITRRIALAAALILTASAAGVQAEEVVKIGLLGMDNYQGVAYAHLFNDPKAEGDLGGVKVTALYPITSKSYPESQALSDRWVDQCLTLFQKSKDPAYVPPKPPVVVDSVDALLGQVDAVIIAALDGNQHLELATPVLKAGKRLYITRPIASTVEDAIAILKLAAETKTPFFSSSQHRYSPGFIGMRNHPEVGNVLGCDVYGGYDLKHADSDGFIRPLHSLETLYTIMRPGCATVACTSTPTAEIFTMTWKDGRTATYRGIKEGKVKYSATVFGDLGVSTAGIYGHGVPVQGVVPTKDKYMGYEGIAIEIAKFFKGGPVPVEAAETAEIYAVMKAAEESKAKGGVPIPVADLLK